LAFGGCSTATPDNEDDLPDSLSALQLFDGAMARLIPARGVTRYEINSASFCDYADSDLVMKLPRNEPIRYTPTGQFEFPVGTVLAQTFSYPDAERNGGRRIVETRVLLRRADKWIGLPYLWNEKQTDAQLELLGARIEVRRQLDNGEVRQQTHIVPNFNDCKRCHRIGDVVTPIAVNVRQLNRRSSTADRDGRGQLSAWQRHGLLQGLPADDNLPRLARWNEPASGTVEQRARAYLESNCAHCHNPRGAASNSGLQLGSDVQKPSAFGILKSPVAAGRGTGGLSFDIVPGEPTSSILLHRLRSIEGGVMMPEVGRTQVDSEGAALLSEWIASMPPATGAFAQAGSVGVVASVTPVELSNWAEESLARGDARRGAEVFQRQELNCTKCHAISGKGANVGPDLAKLDTKNKPEHVVESILLPDRSIKEGFRAVTLETQSGLVITGIQVYDDGHEVLLRDPVRGDTRIAKAEIAARAEGGSLMPANLVAALRREDFLDLVRYLVELDSSDIDSRARQAASP
jgi:uncharacterized repeat protein (TIGR03806 family)